MSCSSHMTESLIRIGRRLAGGRLVDHVGLHALGHYAVLAPKHATSLDQFLGEALRPLLYASGALLFACVSIEKSRQIKFKVSYKTFLWVDDDWLWGWMDGWMCHNSQQLGWVYTMIQHQRDSEIKQSYWWRAKFLCGITFWSNFLFPESRLKKVLMLVWGTNLESERKVH